MRLVATPAPLKVTPSVMPKGVEHYLTELGRSGPTSDALRDAERR